MTAKEYQSKLLGLIAKYAISHDDEAEFVYSDLIDCLNRYSEQLCLEQREICADAVAYKGEISRAEAWGLGADELQDRCEKECRNAKMPEL